MNKKHLKKLIEIGDIKQGYVGTNSKKWGESVLGKTAKLDSYLDKKFERKELFEYCKNNKNNDYDVIVAILSWGGMRRDYGRLFFKNYISVSELIINLRSGKFKTRKEAFKEFQNWRRTNPNLGIGIGYYTKLICFLSPALNGYIMDQWASKSINLLWGEEIVKLQNNVWVNDSNNEFVYETYCQKIDELAVLMGCSGFEAEKRIFSLGYGKGEWRNYLKNHY
jgi:hypothetical protein